MAKRNSTPDKPKRTVFDYLINLVCVLILIGAFIYEYKHLYKPEAPMGDLTALYEKHVGFTFTPPFAYSYYLLKPANYDPEKSYPLILVLHGVSDYAYAGYFLATPEFQKRYPAFVVVPFKSQRSAWAKPQDERYQLYQRGLKFPDALPQAVSLVEHLQKKYAIDQNRTYITGHSAGGAGVFGAAKEHTDVFAAGLTLAGTWAPDDAPYMTQMPLLVYHGTADRQIPVMPSYQLSENINLVGGNAQFIPLEGAGHDIWKIVYPSETSWNWLFKQSK